MNHKIYKGLSTSFEKVITPADSYVSKTVTIDYLMSSPALLATIIEVSWNLFKPLIPDDYITVVSKIQFDYLYPSLVGEKITIEIVVEEIIDNKIHVRVTGIDGVGVFGRGKMVKAIVKNDKLLEAAYKRIK